MSNVRARGLIAAVGITAIAATGAWFGAGVKEGQDAIKVCRALYTYPSVPIVFIASGFSHERYAKLPSSEDECSHPL